MNRRQFLKMGLAGAAIALSGAGAYNLFGKSLNWDFLKPEAQEFPDDYPDVVEQKYPCFGTPKDFCLALNGNDMCAMDVWRVIKPQIKKSIKEQGKEVSDFRVGGSIKTYGVPLEKEVAEGYKEYAELAESHLRDRVSGLTNDRVIWTPIRYGEDHSEDFKGKGFLGKGYFNVANIYAEDLKTGMKIIPEPIGVKHQSTAFVQPNFDHKSGRIGNWYIFLSAGPRSFYLPASEIIPLSTFTRSCTLIDKLGISGVQMAEETISEGISAVLAGELAAHYGIPNSKEIIDEILNGWSKLDRYKLVPRSIAWIKKNGVQQAFDLYMENPERYLEEIQRD